MAAPAARWHLWIKRRRKPVATKKAAAAKLDKAEKLDKVEKPARAKTAGAGSKGQPATRAKAAKGKAGGARPAVRARQGNDNALVIVESPAKAKTIKKYLGRGYVVKASVGHVKDLPRKKMGIDIKRGFRPEYVVIETKKKVLSEIKQAAAQVGKVLLAPDPDREGEAIAWHIADEI